MVRFIETGSGRVGARGWGRRRGSQWLMGTEFHFGRRRILEMVGGDSCTKPLNRTLLKWLNFVCILIPLNPYLKWWGWGEAARPESAASPGLPQFPAPPGAPGAPRACPGPAHSLQWKMHQLEMPQVQQHASRGTMSMDIEISLCCASGAGGHPPPCVQLPLFPGWTSACRQGHQTPADPEGALSPVHRAPGFEVQLSQPQVPHAPSPGP